MTSEDQSSDIVRRLRSEAPTCVGLVDGGLLRSAADVLERVSKVYKEVTGGLVWDPEASAEEVIGAFEEYMRNRCNDAVDTARELWEDAQ